MEPLDFGGQDTSVEEENVDPVGSGNPFLNEVAPQHREIVAPYLQKWDGNATKKFQEYSGKLKPYEALGSIEELTKYRNLANNFRTQPEQVFKLMWEGFQNQYGDDFQQHLLRILQIEEAQQQMSDEFDPGGNEPDPNEIFQKNVMQELEDLRTWRQEQEEARVFAEQNAQLDNVLKMLHTQHGDFDDTWVIQRIAEHGDVNKAITEFNEMIGKYGGSRTPRQAPNTLGGQGGVPAQQVDTKKLRGNDRKALIAQMLEQG